MKQRFGGIMAVHVKHDEMLAAGRAQSRPDQPGPIARLPPPHGSPGATESIFASGIVDRAIVDLAVAQLSR